MTALRTVQARNTLGTPPKTLRFSASKPVQTKMASIKLPQTKPMTSYQNLSQFFGAKTTSEAKAEGRLKVAATNAASKRSALKSILSKTKKKASTHAVPYLAMPSATQKKKSPFQ